MYYIAIHHVDTSDPTRAAALAQVLGVTPYEARARLTTAGPAVVAVERDPQRGRELAEQLRASGFELVVRSDEQLDRPGMWFQVRTLSGSPEALVVTDRSGGSLSLPWAEIRLVVRAMASSSTTTTEEEKTRTFSLGRAALSGGLMTHKTTTTDVTRVAEQRQVLLHVFSDRRPVCEFLEQAVDWQGLGTGTGLSRTAAMAQLVALLKDRSPQAPCDDRLLQKVAQQVLLGPKLSAETHLRLASVLIAGVTLG